MALTNPQPNSKEQTAGPQFDPAPSQFRMVMRRLMRNKASVAGTVIILILVTTAVFAPLLAPYDPIEQNVPGRFAKPSATHILGTDELGRDIFSRIIAGTRLSLLSSLTAVSISLTLGVLIGLTAGYYRHADAILMRLMDVLMAFPGILLAIAIVSALGPGLVNAMIAVGVQSVPSFARITRAQVLSIRQMEYITAVKATGAQDFRILWRHVLPNASAPIIIYTTLNLATAILSASVLSFLGLGASPPTPDWGSMVSTARQFLFNYPHVALFPTLAIFITVLAFNFLGDGLRDALDPRLKDV
ncbi:MAG: ABC transporter permease [Bacillota bacterium]